MANAPRPKDPPYYRDCKLEDASITGFLYWVTEPLHCQSAGISSKLTPGCFTNRTGCQSEFGEREYFSSLATQFGANIWTDHLTRGIPGRIMFSLRIYVASGGLRPRLGDLSAGHLPGHLHGSVPGYPLHVPGPPIGSECLIAGVLYKAAPEGYVRSSNVKSGPQSRATR